MNQISIFYNQTINCVSVPRALNDEKIIENVKQ